MTQVFISYQRESEDVASELHSRLINAGFDVWQDVRKIGAGDDWSREIEEGLRESSVLVLLLTEEAIASHEVRAEWHFFRSEKKPIIPVLVKNCAVPYFLRWINYISYFDNPEKAFEQVIEGIHNYSKSENIREIDVSEEKIQAVTWDAVQAESMSLTTDVIKARYKQKYDENAYVERLEVKAHLKSFLNSNQSVMVLTGKAGTGKSSLICHFASHPPDNVVITLQDSANLQVNDPLEDYFAQQLRIPPALQRVYDHLYRQNDEMQHLIILDAINEHPYGQTLMRHIQNMIDVVSKTSNLKLLITCRLPAWNTLRPLLTFANDQAYQPESLQSGTRIAVEIEAFSKDEVEDAYRKYQQAYDLKTNYQDLPQQVRKLINKPLFMRLIADVRSGTGIKELTLRQVFREYIRKALGTEGFRGLEYAVMTRLVEIMREETTAELIKQQLQHDEKIGRYVEEPETNLNNPFYKLLREGIVSLDERELNIGQVELVFFTYELILEYLLSDVVMTGEPNQVVIDFLERANQPEKAFPQLRGAAELAVVFHLLEEDKPLDQHFSWLLKLAESNIPEMHQFIVGVLQTASEYGSDYLVSNMLSTLMSGQQLSVHIMAMQAAYSLHQDTFLIEMARNAKSDKTRDTAVMFIYQRWDYLRRHQSLETSYQLIDELVANVSWRKLRRFLPSLQALLGVSFFMASDAVRNRDDVLPLVRVYREDVLPKLGLSGFFSRAFGRIVKGLSPVVDFIMHHSIFRNSEHLEDLMTNGDTKQTLMDIWFFINHGALIELKEQLVVSLSNENPMIPWFYRVVLMYYMYNDPKPTTELIIDLFDPEDLIDNPLNFIARFDLLYSLVFGNVIRLMRGHDCDIALMDDIHDMFEDLWDDYHDVMEALDADEVPDDAPVMDPLYYEERMEALLSGIYAIEAISENADSDPEPGSKFLLRVFETHEQPGYGNIEVRGMRILVHGLEKMAYYMFPEFALHSLLQVKVAQKWLMYPHLRAVVVESFSKLNAFYPDEISSLIRKFDRENKLDNLLPLVEQAGAIPISAEVRSMTNSLWTSAVIIEPAAMKIGGLVLFDLARSRDTGQFVGNAIESVATAMSNPPYADAALVAWFNVHETNWNGYERWHIERDKIDNNRETRDRYQKLILEYLDTYGKSRLFN